ncbi:hypothetical protein SAY87_016850 [Trapa incisa]|uniref:Uncharacterized protein n=1 Tax=Trapa incisa TaxID=236973 RepID=A0AAN7LA07_9MYRT|nr:hypothetical protein SAY87_016850 [Trapa incisa]
MRGILHFPLKIFAFFLNSTMSFFLNSTMSFFYKGLVPVNSPTRRRKLPLHTCAVSVISSTQCAYKRAMKLDGPSGSLLRKFAVRFANSAEPYFRHVKSRCLSILTLADDRILATESAIEKRFPLSALVFDKADDLVRAVEAALPEKADWIVAILPGLIHRVPLLGWVLSGVASWLHSRHPEEYPEAEAAREKDIQMDSRSAYGGRGKGDGEEVRERKEPFPSAQEEAKRLVKAEAKTGAGYHCADTASSRISTYKEVLLLQKGSREDDSDGKYEGQMNPWTKDHATDHKKVDKDPIFDLFESGWLMNKPVGVGETSPGSLRVGGSWITG